MQLVVIQALLMFGVFCITTLGALNIYGLTLVFLTEKKGALKVILVYLAFLLVSIVILAPLFITISMEGWKIAFDSDSRFYILVGVLYIGHLAPGLVLFKKKFGGILQEFE